MSLASCLLALAVVALLICLGWGVWSALGNIRPQRYCGRRYWEDQYGQQQLVERGGAKRR
jgi:hypothetical protein